MSLELTKAQQKAIRRAVIGGDYHLLLGAGASVGSLDNTGVNLPTASQLAEELASNFAVPIEDGDLLWRIYARAVDEVGEEEVYVWLRKRYWGVTPPSWLYALARAPWANVWTLNIDDSFERAYDHVKTDQSRPMRTFSWDDNYVQTSDLPVVHLHGCVDRTASRRLVFSLSEYKDSAAAGAAWPLNFRDIYGVSPFVIIGARMRDEPDIEAVVSRRKPLHDAPSIYVNPNISLAMEKDLRAWNLLPVRMTGEDFIVEWLDLVQIKKDGPPTNREALAFRLGRQFEQLQNESIKARKSHDFIGGDEPRWDDIRSGLYAELGWIRDIIADCKSVGRPGIPTSSAIVYVGDRLTGRSTGLLAAARELRAQSWRPLLFRGDERIDVDAVLGYAADGRSVALLFDNVVDFVDDIEVLIARARSADLNILCVAVDGTDRAAKIIGRLNGAYLIHRRVGSINSQLTRHDAICLTDKLNEVARLGILEPRSNVQRIAHFRGRAIFESMAELENAPGFGRRIDDLVSSMNSDLYLQMLLIVAFAARVDRRVLIIDLARAVGIESDEVRRVVSSKEPMSTMIRVAGPWVMPRQRWMALEPCVRKMGEAKAITFLGAALRRLRPRLGRASQRERNATAMLVGAFMKYRNLADAFPHTNLEPWYESLSDIFGTWSSRFWEQRAIMCRDLGREQVGLLARAESFALRAVGTVRDAYSLTTLGTVLLAKAELGAAKDLESYYDRAFDSFQEASREDSGNLVTWFAFLKYALGSVKRVHRNFELFDSELMEKVEHDWLRIHGYLVSMVASSESAKVELAELRTRYRRITGI